MNKGSLHTVNLTAVQKLDRISIVIVSSLLLRRAKLTRWVRDSEVDVELEGGKTIVIGAHVPHLYDFLEDTLMTEVWRHPHTKLPCEYKSWYYKPFRDRIPAHTSIPKVVDGKAVNDKVQT